MTRNSDAIGHLGGLIHPARTGGATALTVLPPLEHRIRLSDAQDLTEAINRRRYLTYQDDQEFSPAGCVKDPTGSLGGVPSTPTRMEWLWPLAGADENKTIVNGAPGEGEIGFFEKLNGTEDWTDPSLTARRGSVRAVHIDELRKSVEWLRRGRWELPIYFAGGLFSILLDTPWIGEHIAHTTGGELRSVGFALLRAGSNPTLGLTDVTIRTGSELEITAAEDCSVEVYHCKRPIDFTGAPPTWNEYDPNANSAWETPGGPGTDDATYIGAMPLAGETPGTLSGATLRGVLQTMVDGGQQNFLVRRSDSGSETIFISGRLRVEFDLDTPLN